MLPTEVKVGPIRYSIEESDEWADLLVKVGAPMYGCTDHARSRIVLDPDLSLGMKQTTLWHEIKHAVWFMAGGGSEVDEETALQFQTPLELQVLQENPQVCQYLLYGPHTLPVKAGKG